MTESIHQFGKAFRPVLRRLVKRSERQSLSTYLIEIDLDEKLLLSFRISDCEPARVRESIVRTMAYKIADKVLVPWMLDMVERTAKK